MRLIAALAFALVATTASAQTPPALLTTTTFETLDLYRVPSLVMSKGWSACVTLVVGEDRLMRVWYRQSDGLVVATLHDTRGHVLTQTRRGWFIGRNLDQFSATLSTFIDRAVPPTSVSRSVEVLESRVNISAYNQSSGEFIEAFLTWSSRER